MEARLPEPLPGVSDVRENRKNSLSQKQKNKAKQQQQQKPKESKRVKDRVSKYPDGEVGLKGRHFLPHALFLRHTDVVVVVTLHHGIYSRVVGRYKPTPQSSLGYSIV